MTIYDCFIYLPAKLESLFDIHKFSEDFFCQKFSLIAVLLFIQPIIKEKIVEIILTITTGYNLFFL